MSLKGVLTFAFLLVLLVTHNAAARRADDEPGWEDVETKSIFDPDNHRGRNPLDSALLGRLRQGLQGSERKSLREARNAGSGNFQLTVPVVNLTGRGLDLTLALIYNSRLWHKAGNRIYFDMDAGWPAPGWSLGFGKLVYMEGGQSMLIDADGTPNSYKPMSPRPNLDFTGHTTDGTFIVYSHSATGPNKNMLVSARAEYPNGKVVTFGAPSKGKGVLYPVKIMDADGNYISITYRNNTGPQIDTIVDTLGRIIRFHYDDNGNDGTENRPLAITGPKVHGGDHTLLRLHYKSMDVDPQLAFYAGVTPVPNRGFSLWVIDAIYYPATATGYWLTSYSPYWGMLMGFSERRTMTALTPSPNDQGTISPGIMTRRRSYNYPTQPPPAHRALSDAPTYDTMTEEWEGMDTPPAETKYEERSGTQRRVTVTHPDGTQTVQLFEADGRLAESKTYDAGGKVLLHQLSPAWEPGDYASLRLQHTETTNERNQVKRTMFSYGDKFNQVTEVREFDYMTGGTPVLLRRVTTEYENANPYIQRHILNLPKVVQVFDGSGSVESRTEYSYDLQPLADAPGVVQQDPDPYPFLSEYRGHVTKVTAYADGASRTGAVVEERRYDITGNLMRVTPACCEQTSYGYSPQLQYAYPTEQTRGAADSASPIWMTTYTGYDFNTGLLVWTVDANGRTTKITYSDALRPKEIQWPTKAVTVYDYDDATLKTTETVYYKERGGLIARQGHVQLNGLESVLKIKQIALGDGKTLSTCVPNRSEG